MSRTRLSALLLIAGSASLLLGALGFQYIGGLAPCGLCLTQRWSHAAVILAALPVALGWRPLRLWLPLALLANLQAAAQGLRHVGVEQGWWKGPTACSGASQLIGQSGAELLDFSQPVHVVRCTDIAWEMFGISMAGWNGLLTLAIGSAALWIWRRRRVAGEKE